MPEAAGVGQALAGALEAGKAHHQLCLDWWMQFLGLVALGWALWTMISSEAAVFGSRLTQPRLRKTKQRAGTQEPGLWQ